MGSVQMPGPWGLAQFLELKASQWVEGDQFPPNQAQAELWGPSGCSSTS